MCVWFLGGSFGLVDWFGALFFVWFMGVFLGSFLLLFFWFWINLMFLSGKKIDLVVTGLMN